MQRRRFIKLTGLGAGSVVLASQLSGCDTVEPTLIGWSAPDSNQRPLLQILSYAMLAPNPHNTQAWQVRILNDHECELYVDKDRLLPETDPFYRQIHIGQGTFLETFSIAASHFKLRAEIDYFPQGEYGNDELLPMPVAKIRLSPSEAPEYPLFAFLLQRHSNKRSYEQTPLTDQDIEKLVKEMAKNQDTEFFVTSAEKQRAALQQFLTDAMVIESADSVRDLETIAMFRFNDDEIRHYRDGFGIAQAGTTGVKKWLAESFFLSREKAEQNPKQFGQQAIGNVKAVAASTQTFAWLQTAINSRLDQVKTGRDYCRLNLITTAMGIAQHPMSQVLQEYEDMLSLQEKFKHFLGVPDSHTVQMFCRLGYAAACPHTPRRELNDILGHL